MTVSAPSSMKYVRTIGAFGANQVGLCTPVDLAVGSDGRLYVVNASYRMFSGAPRGLVGPSMLTGEPFESLFTRVSIMTMDDEVPRHFGPEGTGDGQLIWATGVATDDRNNVYVCDAARHDVQVFDEDGQFLRKWGSFGRGSGQLNGPAGLAVDRDGNVLVVDALNSRVQKFSPAGEPLAAWGEHGSSPGKLDRPWGVAVGADGAVYVADWGNDRVGKFSGDGAYVSTFGSSGSGEAGLRRPSGVAVDDDGHLYVADFGNNRVQVFDADGSHAQTLLGDSALSKAALRFFEDFPARKAEYDKEDPSAVAAAEAEYRTLRGPTAVKIDPQGRLLVVDCGRNRIVIYERR